MYLSSRIPSQMLLPLDFLETDILNLEMGLSREMWFVTLFRALEPADRKKLSSLGKKKNHKT